MMGKKLIEDARERIVCAKPLKAYVAKDHLLVKIDEAIDFSFIYTEVKDLYAAHGTDSTDPVVIFKMLLIGYLYDISSERKLVESISENLAYRYFIGYALDEEIPYRTNFTRIRERWGEDTFRSIFNRIVQMCIETNLVGNKSASIDSTCVKAKGTSQIDELYREQKIQAYLDSVTEAGEAIKLNTIREIKQASPGKRGKNVKKNSIPVT